MWKCRTANKSIRSKMKWDCIICVQKYNSLYYTTISLCCWSSWINLTRILLRAAKLTNNEGNPITDALGNNATPFEYGSGHIQPSKAADPGLVYDASYKDYLMFLCRSSGNLLDPSFDCPLDVPSPSNLNYPSLAIANLQGSVTIVRTVTNVGAGKSSYSVVITPPPGYAVRISPSKLYFSETGENQSFNVTVEVGSIRNEYAFGWYTWSDGVHEVRSPISVWTLLWTKSLLHMYEIKIFIMFYLCVKNFLIRNYDTSIFLLLNLLAFI